MTPKNIPEFIALIKRYESITLEEIEEASPCYISTYGLGIARKLTGYGSYKMCTLCKKVNTSCVHCVYKTNDGCTRGVLKQSYLGIHNANSQIDLLDAFRNRAKVLRQYAVNIGINIE